MRTISPSSESEESIGFSEENWTAVLKPPKGLFHIPWKELWEYKELIGLLVHRDYISIYKQTFLGSLWHVLQPLLQTIMFVLVFSNILKIPTNGIPPILFFLSGLACWRYFADCAIKISTTFIDNQGMFDKIYFPRIVVPIAQIIVNLIRFFIQIALFLCLYIFFYIKGAAIHPDWRLIVFPLLVIELGALGLGVGCLISAFTTRYRDLVMSVDFFMQLWMYASCVVYPLSEVPSSIRWFVEFNPIVPIIEAFRYAFMGAGAVTLSQTIRGGILSVIIMVFGIMVFNKVARKSVDEV